MLSRFRGAAALVSLALLFGAGPSAAFPHFSLDGVSPTLFTLFLSPSDVFAPGPIGGPPLLAFPAAGIGLVGPPYDDLDAMALPGALGQLHFSVDRVSAGLPIVFGVGPYPPLPAFSHTFLQAGLGQQAGDIYVRGAPGVPGLPVHLLAYNQDALGEIPALGFSAPSGPPLDALDALDLINPGFPPPIPAILSMAPGHAYMGGSGFSGCGGDLFYPTPGGAAPFLSYGALGLASCGDDIDALAVVLPAGELYFSLAPGSPSLTPIFSPIAGCAAAGCSAADVFGVPLAGGVAALELAAADLGLAPGDNVTSLAMSPCAFPSGVDSDGDGFDDACDNCTLDANPTQFDGDVDGFGNACDADYDNTGFVSIADFAIFASSFTSLGNPRYRPDVDWNESRTVNIADFNFFKLRFGGPPGPSGWPCAGTVPCTH